MRAVRTFGQALDAADNRPSGFDYLRIGLALGIFFVHCLVVSEGPKQWESLYGSPLRPFEAWLVPSFFALSGFLVSGSLVRSRTLLTFLGLRVLRIFPALVVEVFLCALVLGPLFTSLPLSAYFADHRFHIYFMNTLGVMHYYLPGVFQDNPVKNVNYQLWTVPFELECYIALSALFVVGIAKRNSWLLVAIFVIQSASILIYTYKKGFGGPFTGDTVTGKNLVMCFLFGVLLYQFRYRIIYTRWLTAIAAVSTWALLLTPYGSNFIGLPLSYLTVALGLCNPKRNTFALSGDYSYGVYLYSLPIQQMVVSLGVRTWWGVLLVAGAITLMFAALSWHLIEKNVLRLRPGLKALEDRVLLALAKPRPVSEAA